MLPIFRSLISFPAGVVNMPLTLFIVLTTIGSLIWNMALISAGFFLGENWAIVEDYVGTASKVMAGIVLIGLVAWVIVRVRSRKKM